VIRRSSSPPFRAILGVFEARQNARAQNACSVENLVE
jgi:hypothetical protein